MINNTNNTNNQLFRAMKKYDPRFMCLGKTHTLNISLLITKSINEKTANRIKSLHRKKLRMFDVMQKLDPIANIEQLKTYETRITKNEFALQELWGFEKKANYHKFWELPHCNCPSLDNLDMYPSDSYYINASCLYHGKSK